MLLTTKALVLRSAAAGDQDRILTLLSSDLGVISVSARGASKTRNRFTAVSQSLIYAEFLLFKGNSRYSLNSGEVLASFFDIATIPENYEQAVKLLETAEIAGIVPDSAGDILLLLLHALHKLLPSTKISMSPRLVSAIFLFRLAQISGYKPFLSGCTECKTSKIEHIRFSFASGGFLCEQCKQDDATAVLLPLGVAKAMLYTMSSPVDHLFRFSLDTEFEKLFYSLAQRYVSEKLERLPKPRVSYYSS